MPARRLFDNAQTIQPYDVLTQTDGASDLMVHALLFHDTEPRSGVTRSTTLRVFHMGPPLGLRRDTVDAVGSANLTPKQRRQVKAFMDDRLLEKKAQLANDVWHAVRKWERLAQDTLGKQLIRAADSVQSQRPRANDQGQMTKDK